MKSIDNIIMFQNLQADVWGYATHLLNILQWFDGEEATDKAITQGLLVDDAKDSFIMWCDLANVHYNTWTEWMEAIDLDSVDSELFDDCPNDNTLSNRLRIVKLRAGAMWNKEEYDNVCNKLIHSFFRLKALVLATYEIEEDDAHKLTKQIHDRLTNRFINVHMMQGVVQSIIDKGEQILNPQPTPTETEPQRAVKPIKNLLDDEDIRAVFEIAIARQWITKEGDYYRWNSTTHSLAYLVQQVSNHFSLSQKYFDNGEGVNWSAFNGLFIVDTKQKKDLIPTGDDIRGFKNNWYRSARRSRTDPFLPDGCKEIDDWLMEVF